MIIYKLLQKDNPAVFLATAWNFNMKLAILTGCSANRRKLFATSCSSVLAKYSKKLLADYLKTLSVILAEYLKIIINIRPCCRIHVCTPSYVLFLLQLVLPYSLQFLKNKALTILFLMHLTIYTTSSSVAKRLRDASCLSVVSFNSAIPRVQLFLLVTSASNLPVRTIQFCSVVFGVTSSLAVIHMIHVHPD